MSVEDVIKLEVIIVLSQGIVQCLCHSKPPEVEEEFDRHKDRIVDVHFILFNSLLPNERDREVDVDGKCDHLKESKGSEGELSYLFLTWV